MKHSMLKAIALTVALFGITNSLQAQQQQQNDRQPPKRLTVNEAFKLMDSNEDDLLTKEETKGPLNSDFEKLDTNKDGYISRKELADAPQPNRKRRARQDNDSNNPQKTT